MKLFFKFLVEYIFFVIDLNLLILSVWVLYFILGLDIGCWLKILVLFYVFRLKIVYRLFLFVIKYYKLY